MKKNGFTSIIKILIVVVLGLVGYFAYQKISSIRNSPVFIYKGSNSSENQPTDSYFKSNLNRKNEKDISSYFKDYPTISVSPNGKYVTRRNDKVLEIALAKDLSFKQTFFVDNENGKIYGVLWSSDSTSIALLTVEGRDDVGLLNYVPKTLYLINANTLENKKLHTFEKGSDLWFEVFDSDTHKIHIVEAPPNTGVIIPGTERYSSVDTITGKVNSENIDDITNEMERKNGHKYFVSSNEKILYDLDLSLNTKSIIFDAKDGYISEIKYLSPKNKQFVFTEQKSNKKNGKFTLYSYDVDTQKLSILAENLNGKVYMQPSLDGRYVWIREFVPNGADIYRVFDMITKQLTTFNKPNDKYKYYHFYWISE